MPVSFNEIAIGSTWERTDLADLWGYESFHALARGAVTPSGDNKIILFVKEEKRPGDAPYEDKLEDDMLRWHGEEKHGSDNRILRASESGDEIHVFYKKTHTEPFTYLGMATLIESSIETLAPSRFSFLLKGSSAVEEPAPIKKMPSKPRLWTRDELIVAMNLYCKLEFGQFHARNPTIIEVAARIDRTPGSLAMKLCNFASLDPFHAARGVSGLSGTSQADRAIWNEFNQNWEDASFESEKLLARMRGIPLEQEARIDEASLPREGLERERIVRQRVNQYFFRSTILAAYDNRCCITGIALPELIVASRVVPWSINKKARVNPRNGLCLNALHDRAFDRGLMTITTDFRVELSPRLRKAPASPGVLWLNQFEGKAIKLPERFQPEQEFLQWHRENLFVRE